MHRSICKLFILLLALVTMAPGGVLYAYCEFPPGYTVLEIDILSCTSAYDSLLESMSDLLQAELDYRPDSEPLAPGLRVPPTDAEIQERLHRYQQLAAEMSEVAVLVEARVNVVHRLSRPSRGQPFSAATFDRRVDRETFLLYTATGCDQLQEPLPTSLLVVVAKICCDLYPPRTPACALDMKSLFQAPPWASAPILSKLSAP